MELTREQAVREHRKMWNWMSDNMEREKPRSIAEMKHNYLVKHGFDPKEIIHFCFLCEYVRNEMNKTMPQRSPLHYKCDLCPIDWASVDMKNNRCIGYDMDNETIYDLIDTMLEKRMYKEVAKNAKIIANLPEKECDANE